MSPFNNREIALAIWILVVLVSVLSISNIRKSLSDVIKCFFKIKIQISLIIMMAYTTGVVIALYLLSLWKISLIKDTIIWFCFLGVVMCFNMVTSSKEENLFRKIILNNIKIVIIIEFLVNTYTFSLVGELIFLPFITFIAMLDTIAQTEKKYSSASKLITGLQSIIGVTILIYAISKAISDYKNLGSLDTLRSFLLAPLLSISFLPLIYLMLVFSAYENLFKRLNLGHEKSSKLKNYAKKEIIKHCKFSLKKIKKASNMNVYNLMQIRNEKDVEDMVEAYKGQV